MRLALDGAFEPERTASIEPVAALRLWQRPLPATLGAIVIAAVSGLLVSTFTDPDRGSDGSSRTSARLSVVLPETTPLQFLRNLPSLAFSPDGIDIVYTTDVGSGPEIHRRPIDQLTAEPVPNASGSAPFFSPDGVWMGFLSRDQRTIRKVPRAGGPAVTVAEAPVPARGAHWDEDGHILFGTTQEGLYRVSVSGGKPEVLTTLDAERGETSHRWPFRIPGTQIVVFNTTKGVGGFAAVATGELAALDLDSGQVTPLALAGVSPRYTPMGHLVYANEDGDVLAVPFDPTSLEVSGNPVPVVRGVYVHSSGASHFSL